MKEFPNYDCVCNHASDFALKSGIIKERFYVDDDVSLFSRMKDDEKVYPITFTVILFVLVIVLSAVCAGKPVGVSPTKEGENEQ